MSRIFPLQWRIFTLSAIYCLFATFQLFAQKAEEMRIEHITEEQGLSSSVVHTIFQDKQGMLWFGAFDGLNEYDGMKFRHFHQTLPDSLSNGISAVRCIAQDFTGALWLATNSKRGVSRFNPITQTFGFFPITSKNAPLTVTAILEDAENTLWFATSRGLYRLDRQNMSIQAHSEVNVLASASIIALAEDASKTLWIATKTSIFRLDKGRTSLRKLECGLPSNVAISNLVQQSDSAQTLLWLGTEASGIICVNAQTSQIHASYTQAQGLEQGLTSNSIRSLICLKNGDVWAGTDKGISIIQHSRNLQTSVITRLQADPKNPATLSGNMVYALLEDASGVVWAAAEFYGLNKYTRFRHKFQHISASLFVNKPSLSSNYIRGIAETPASNGASYLWFATQTGGLNRLNRATGEWAYYRKDKLGSDTSWTLRFDGKETLWIGLVHGGAWMYNTRTQAMTRFAGIPADATIQIIMLDKQGMVWFAGDSYPLTALLPNHSTRQYSISAGATANPERILCLLEDKRGRFLVGTDKGLRELDRTTGAVRVLLPGVVNALYEDASEALWVGTRGQGLQQFRRKTASNEESLYVLGEREGLPNSTVSAILPDAQGTLWVSTKRGLAHIDPKRRKVLHIYDTDDGLQGNEFHRESAFRSASGELFFGGTNGVNSFFPDRISSNRTPPPVAITSVKKSEREELLTDSTVQATNTVRLRYDENALSFGFVALDYNSPDHNVFAYKLDGLDKGWIQCGNRREATYTSLEPGEYTFHVRAANNDGVWNEEGATMRVIIAPPIWRTWWFIALSVASAICIGFVAYRARIRGIEARNEWLEKQVTTRTAELRTANVELQQINNKLSDSLNEIQILSSVLDGERNKSEDLLLNILPPSIAERLKWGETTIVDTFESATVLFSDMVGFTKIASRVTPEELIVMLNRMFSVFDQLAEVHGVEKIKTIGDAYMAVAGVPIPNEEHASAIAAMALDMLLAIQELAENEQLPISIRVGMHTGYLTAGVIGEKKFAYDLWGDTVNTASRMESSGEAGRVQCSETTYLLLKDKFEFEERGMIEVKGKGAMKTYFITGQKGPHWSEKV
jgi:ligand-binding sensor domain-containing protein/class 3 adenylate cyclase